MTLWSIIAAYLLIGIGLSFTRHEDIAAEATPGDPNSTILVAARWVATWPLWALAR